MKNHIVIIGFNGSGKKRVGKRLAKDLGLPYVDVDKEIVRKMKMRAVLPCSGDDADQGACGD